MVGACSGERNAWQKRFLAENPVRAPSGFPLIAVQDVSDRKFLADAIRLWSGRMTRKQPGTEMMMPGKAGEVVKKMSRGCKKCGRKCPWVGTTNHANHANEMQPRTHSIRVIRVIRGPFPPRPETRCSPLRCLCFLLFQNVLDPSCAGEGFRGRFAISAPAGAESRRREGGPGGRGRGRLSGRTRAGPWAWRQRRRGFRRGPHFHRRCRGPGQVAGH